MKKFFFSFAINWIFFTSLGYSLPRGSDVILTIGGDLNLSPSNVSPDPDGTCKHGRCYTWSELFQGLKPLLIGDLNFYNLETVVTDGYRNLEPKGGKYLFQSHVEGVRYAKSIGLNWISLANNHVGDYGTEGMIETLERLEQVSAEGGPFLYHGISRERQQILKPSIIEIDSANAGKVRIAFAAITFVRNTPMQIDDYNPGVIYPENARDMNALLANFRRTPADFKVLSIHGGKEKQMSLDSWQSSRYRKFLEQGDIDLIIGHHPHRVRPVERVGNKVIFYSLGNYLMLGAEGLNGYEDSEDFGLMGRLYLKRGLRGHLEINRIEAIPIFNMQSTVYALKNSEAKKRIESLNQLTFEQLGTSGVQWETLPNGWGSSCWLDCPTGSVQGF